MHGIIAAPHDPYQVGQKFEGLQCDISPNIWSAAYNENAGN